MFFKNVGSGSRSCRANFQFSFFPTNLVILLFLLFALFLSFPNLIYFFYICSYRRTWATKNLGTFYFVLRAFHSFWESGLEINPGSEPMPLMGGEILWLCRASSWAHRLSLVQPSSWAKYSWVRGLFLPISQQCVFKKAPRGGAALPMNAASGWKEA